MLQSTVNTQLQQLENEIAAKQAEVNEITPQYSQLTEAGQRMRTE